MFKKSLAYLTLLACASFSTTAVANYPERPIHMIIPLAAGSAIDVAARLVMQRASEHLGQPVVIENVPGAAGAIGAQRLAQATPDGYTIGGFNDSILVMVPHVMKNLKWDPLTSFDPITVAATVELGMIANKDAPFESIADVIEAARKNGDNLTYGSGGVGSPQHIGMAMFLDTADLTMRHIPYRGATPAAIAVGAGEVDLGLQGIATAASLVHGGRVKLLAVSAADRLNMLPDTPTFSESGLPGFSFTTWFALVAPVGTPGDAIDRVQQAVAKALEEPEVKNQLLANGLTPWGSTPAEMKRDLAAQFTRYGKLIKDHNIGADEADK